MSSEGGGQSAFPFMGERREAAEQNRASDDKTARERIRSELDVNFVVEAAAGTGKTTNLVDRLVALIADAIASPRQIAAITFTKKAAGELRERFQNVLEREAREAEPDSQRLANIRKGLEQIDQSYLGTIHSFCGRMLRERPVEAGVAPDFRELEEVEATALNEEVWASYVQELYLERSDLLLELDQTDLTIVELRNLMLSLCDETDVDLVTEKRPRPDLRPAWRELIRIAAELEREMPLVPPERGWDDLQKLIRSTAALRRASDPDDLAIIRLLKDFETSNPEGRVTNNRWPDSDPNEIKESIRGLCENVVTPTLRAWREYCHPIAVEVVTPAIERARETRIDLGRLSFQDLLTIARDLLRDHRDVRRWFQDRYRYVLVDEFQDTDPIQAEILFYLTGEGSSDSWRELRPRPGSLFIVGDPKQSIYRFRRADIGLYKEVKDLIVGSGGEVLQLSRNFRSTGQLCDWVNGRFAAILPPEETAEQAAMVRVEANRSDRGGFGGVYVQRFAGKGISQVARQESEHIARWIRDAVQEKRTVVDSGDERPMGWGDFMILARERPRLKIYADALERHMIPYEITGGRGFSSSRELRALR
ncbi:MAG: UvrD-helicase domain-containing protein, partial [Acidobacteria bacterium]|nr:UvrD-helicase domain-containing protein [Acidobacteriota bacterium]